MTVITHRIRTRRDSRSTALSSRQPLTPVPPTGRPRHGLVATAAIAMIAVTGVLAGCGTVAKAGAAAGAGKSHASAKTSLTVSIINESPKTKHFRLTCQPVGGNAPDAAGLCKTLEAMKKPFGPLNKHLMCPMIIVSDHQIVVSGTWLGQKVHRVITDGGCDLTAFNSLAKVLH